MERRLNEWHFAMAIDKGLKSNKQISFDILPGTTNVLYDLIVRDDKGLIYRIKDSDTQELYSYLLKNRNLVYNVDIVNSKITYRIKSEFET